MVTSRSKTTILAVLAVLAFGSASWGQVYTPPVSNAPYGPTWNGDNYRAPSRNALWDVIATLGPAADPNIVAIAGIDPVAGDMFYWTAPGAVSKFTTTSYGRSLLGTANAPAAAVTLVQDRVYDIRWAGCVGDGVTDNAVNLNVALTAGAGGIVYVPEGTWGFGAIIYVPANTQLVGGGAGSVLRYLANTTIRIDGASHAAIRNLKITADVAVSSGIRVLNDSEYAEIADVDVDGTTNLISQVVHIYDANHISVRRCNFLNCSREVIQEMGYRSDHGIVDDCTFRGSVSYGVTLNCGTTAPSRNWQIVNSRFLDHTDFVAGGGASDGAISLTNVENVVMSGLQIYRMAGNDTIHMENLRGDVVFADSVMENCVAAYAYLQTLNTGKHCVISNIIIKHTDTTRNAYGIRSYADYYENDLQILGCRIVGNASETLLGGIALSYMPVGRKIIADCIIKDCAIGIAVRRCDNLVMTGNQVFSGTVGMLAGGGNNDDVTLSANRFSGSNAGWKVAHDATYPYNRRWVVADNVVDPCGFAYNAWDWQVVGNQVPANGTLRWTLGDVQRLTQAYNTGDAMAVNLSQGGQTMALGTLNLGVAAYTPDLWYKCDDNAADKVIADSSGAGANLTAWVNTSTRTVAGVVGTALDFNGVADRGYRNTASAAGSSGSVVAWIRPTTLAAVSCVVSESDEASTTRYAMFYVDDSGRLTWAQRNADTADRVNGNTRMLTGEWAHVAATSTGAAYALYVNGQPQTLTASSGSNNGDWWDDATAKDNLVLGALVSTSASSWWAGYLDDVRVYSETLTAAQVKYMYTARAETFPAAMTWDGQAVSIGANDSAGAGYRLVRIPN